ncbi:MAG: hypothetical protein NW201_08095 [Gemmatimonadales bacterium]|nr:hypothetical protein [Gemmatimonadales bacterium]
MHADERDPLIGSLLKAEMPLGGDAAFAARVRLALDPAEQVTDWDILARWLRPGVAAAALLAFAIGWSVARARAAEVAAGTQAPPHVYASEAAPERDVLLAAFVMEAR